MSLWHFILFLENGSRQLGGWRSRLPQLRPASPGAPMKSLGTLGLLGFYLWFVFGGFLHISLLLIMNPIQMDFCSHHAPLSRGQCGNACSDCLMPQCIFSLKWSSPIDELKPRAEQQLCALKPSCCSVHLACQPSIPGGKNYACCFQSARWYSGSWPKLFPSAFLLDKLGFHNFCGKWELFTGLKNFSPWERWWNDEKECFK